MGALLPAIATPSNAAAVKVALINAWPKGELRADVLALLLALSDLETATWTRMWRYNLGNLIRTDAWAGDWYQANDAGNAREFRAYSNLQDGADDLIRLLTSSERPQWKAGLLTGDPQQFVAALAGKNGGPRYFEANAETYLNGFLTRWRKYGDSAEIVAVDSAALAKAPSSWYILPVLVGIGWLLIRGGKDGQSEG